jgi:hypothetical protein
MVGVLAQNDDLYSLKRAHIECTEYFPAGRINGVLAILRSDKLGQLKEIGFFKFIG